MLTSIFGHIADAIGGVVTRNEDMKQAKQDLEKQLEVAKIQQEYANQLQQQYQQSMLDQANASETVYGVDTGSWGNWSANTITTISTSTHPVTTGGTYIWPAGTVAQPPQPGGYVTVNPNHPWQYTQFPGHIYGTPASPSPISDLNTVDAILKTVFKVGKKGDKVEFEFDGSNWVATINTETTKMVPRKADFSLDEIDEAQQLIETLAKPKVKTVEANV